MARNSFKAQEIHITLKVDIILQIYSLWILFAIDLSLSPKI